MKRLLVVALGVAVSACVSSGKYDGVVKNLKDCQDQVGACATDRDGARARVTELEKQTADLTATLDKVQAGAGATAAELAELRKRNAEAEKRLASFKALTAKFQKMIDSGKLKIGFRNGLMIVKLPAGILFASGKADLSEEGGVTVTEVGAVLKDLTNRRFLIAGHTDNVPLKRGKFKDNWELSTARALVVSRWLVEQGMNPKAIAAAGYSEFDPVADNANEAGRQENRRIEIVLMPNIEELPAMPTN
jgi:chemotaxis protein MotB